MKKFIIVLLLLLFTVSSVFALNLSLGASVDASSLWVRPLSIGGDVRLDILDNLRLRVPLTFDKGDYRNLFSVGIVVDYSPFNRYTGMFLGFAVAEIGFLYQTGGKLQMIFINELELGFRQSMFNNYLFLESVLCVRDPTFAFSSSYKEIQSSIPSYSRFKFRINIGINFDLFTKNTPKSTNTSSSKSSSKRSTSSKK